MLSLLCPVWIPDLTQPHRPRTASKQKLLGQAIHLGLVCYTAMGNQKELGISPAYNEKKEDSMVYLKCNIIKQLNLESQHYIMMP